MKQSSLVTEQLEELKFTTAIAQPRSLSTQPTRKKILYVEYAEGFIQLLALFAPHFWPELGRQ